MDFAQEVAGTLNQVRYARSMEMFYDGFIIDYSRDAGILQYANDGKMHIVHIVMDSFNHYDHYIIAISDIGITKTLVTVYNRLPSGRPRGGRLVSRIEVGNVERTVMPFHRHLREVLAELALHVDDIMTHALICRIASLEHEYLAFVRSLAEVDTTGITLMSFTEITYHYDSYSRHCNAKFIFNIGSIGYIVEFINGIAIRVAYHGSRGSWSCIEDRGLTIWQFFYYPAYYSAYVHALVSEAKRIADQLQDVN